MKIYHNEINDRCSEVLERRFPDSVVDRRSIEDVQPEEIAQYRQCHFFAGIGGFSEAFRRAGLGPDCNVWTGGFPCQDLSVAGKRAGLAGSRSGLYFHFQRLVAQSRPDIVLAENVPGLLSSNGGRDFAIVLGGFTGIIPAIPDGGWGSAGFLRGRVYSVAYRIFDAQYFGVAQRRRRVFIVASLAARGRSVGAKALQDGKGLSGLAAEILFEREGVYGDPPARGQAGQGTAGSLSARTKAGGFPGTDEAIDGYLTVHETGKGFWTEGLPGLRSQPGGMPENVIAFQQNTRDEVRLMNGDGQIVGSLAAQAGMKQQNYVMSSGQANAEILQGKSPTLSLLHEQPIVAFTSKDNGRDVQKDISPTLRSMGHDQSHMNGGGQVAIANWQSGGGRMDDDKAASLRSGAEASYQFAHGSFGVRRLVPVECERLQGFEDDWTDEQSDSVRYRQLGNAVAVTNVEWIARRIRRLYQRQSPL